MPSKYTPKLLTQDQIDKLKGTAKENAQRNRGLAVDEELKTLVPILEENLKNFPELKYEQRYIIPVWIQEGCQILRNEAWGKHPLDLADEDEDELQDWTTPFEERVFANCFVDSLAVEFADRAKKFHLTPELVQFTIRVLEAALHHERDLPGAAFQDRQELTQYLADLKETGESYREPPKPKGKPGPKPKLPVIAEHAGPNSYVLYESEVKPPDHSGVRDDLPLDFRNWK